MCCFTGSQNVPTFDEFIVGMSYYSFGETQRRITRLFHARHPELLEEYPDLLWAAEACYTLGVIDGKRAERARRKKGEDFSLNGNMDERRGGRE
jgi:hypothetical protein